MIIRCVYYNNYIVHRYRSRVVDLRPVYLDIKNDNTSCLKRELDTCLKCTLDTCLKFKLDTCLKRKLDTCLKIIIIIIRIRGIWN